jgi:NAD(P)-dependent dehydrogenase (short-subunit alcohol dehydrogenase family)
MPMLGPYAASKFALEALSDSLRVELRPWGIDVICIEPGAVATPIWDKSLSKADELARDLPEAGHRLYGDRIESTRKRAREANQKGVPVETVAHRVALALTANRPKTRYLVGRYTRWAVLLMNLLPDRLRDRLVAAVR